jgi:hypothetical protein
MKRKPRLIVRPFKGRKRAPAKKPRTLNAVWGDSWCSVDPDGTRQINCGVQRNNLTAAQALRLSQWLAEAAAWKAEE